MGNMKMDYELFIFTALYVYFSIIRHQPLTDMQMNTEYRCIKKEKLNLLDSFLLAIAERENSWENAILTYKNNMGFCNRKGGKKLPYGLSDFLDKINRDRLDHL